MPPPPPLPPPHPTPNTHTQHEQIVKVTKCSAHEINKMSTAITMQESHKTIKDEHRWKNAGLDKVLILDWAAMGKGEQMKGQLLKKTQTHTQKRKEPTVCSLS